jgi:hypothetical protein
MRRIWWSPVYPSVHFHVDLDAAAFIQHRVLRANVFLYPKVFTQDIEWLDHVRCARKAKKLLVILTQEVKVVLAVDPVPGRSWLICCTALDYG